MQNCLLTSTCTIYIDYIYVCTVIYTQLLYCLLHTSNQRILFRAKYKIEVKMKRDDQTCTEKKKGKKKHARIAQKQWSHTERQLPRKGH